MEELIAGGKTTPKGNAEYAEGIKGGRTPLLPFPDKKYKTIYADPPWPERGGGKIKRGADRHYKLMSVEEIKALPVQSIAAENSHLYLWVTNNYLPAGLEVMAAWGFRYTTMITWAKDKMGLGQYFRGKTEHCLFGVRGNLPYKMAGKKRMQGVTLITEKRTKHSRKPDRMKLMIMDVSYPPYMELFGRERWTGWDVWGDEAPTAIQNKLGGKQCTSLKT